MSDEQPEKTRTPKTEKLYVKRTRNFIREYLIDNPGVNVRSISSEGFGLWMIGKKSKIASSSWRQYRSAVLCYAQSSRILDHAILFRILNSDEVKSIKCSVEGRNKRAKSIKVEDVLLVKEYLFSKKNRHSHIMTYCFFMASMVVGFRPCEWKNCTIEFYADGVAVEVLNGKFTNGRSFGEKRKIHVDNSAAEEIFFIKKWLEYIDKIRNNCESDEHFAKEYDNRIKAMQKQFRVMNAAIFPQRAKKIQLYTARHQAAANFKSMGFSQVELAALMGQASIYTAPQHYGRKSQGRGGNSTKVKPDPENVRQVELLNLNAEPSKYVSKEERAAAKQLAVASRDNGSSALSSTANKVGATPIQDINQQTIDRESIRKMSSKLAALNKSMGADTSRPTSGPSF